LNEQKKDQKMTVRVHTIFRDSQAAHRCSLPARAETVLQEFKLLSARAETVSQECKPLSVRAETVLQKCKPLSARAEVIYTQLNISK
jgi:hypothetical protein